MAEEIARLKQELAAQPEAQTKHVQRFLQRISRLSHAIALFGSYHQSISFISKILKK